MKKKEVREGEIVMIAAGECYVAAKVLYLSKWFKDLILLGLYKEPLSDLAMPASLSSKFAQMVYTSQEPILKGRWNSVGHEPLLPWQTGLAKRIVGGEVWLGDECLGAASKADFDELPRMQALGAALVEKRALSWK